MFVGKIREIRREEGRKIREGKIMENVWRREEKMRGVTEFKKIRGIK